MNMSTEVRRGQFPDRCGTCKKFPGNKKICGCYAHKKDGTIIIGAVRYANDYGKGVCINYE